LRAACGRSRRNRTIRPASWRPTVDLVSDASVFSSYPRSSDICTRDSGAGPIGLVTLLAARAAGAEPIVITDLFQNRLDFAKSLVPTARTVLIGRGESAKETAQRIKDAAGMPLTVALECTGVESSIHGAIYVSRFRTPKSRPGSSQNLQSVSTVRGKGFRHWSREE